MHFIAFLAAVVAFGMLFPKASNALAYVITFGFLVPFLTVAVGTLTWTFAGIAGLTMNLESWIGSCVFAGLPFGGFVAWFIMSGESL